MTYLVNILNYIYIFVEVVSALTLVVITFNVSFIFLLIPVTDIAGLFSKVQGGRSFDRRQSQRPNAANVGGRAG